MDAALIASAVCATGWVAAAGLWHRLRCERELVARAGHEVRGPLTALGLGLEVMRRRHEGPPARLDALEAQVARARRALGDLACASHRRRAENASEDVPLAAWVARLRETWAPLAVAAGRRLRVEPGPAGWVVSADPVRLDQAAGNLLANALEHGAGTVHIGVRVADGVARIEVRDEGDGLPAALPLLLRRPRAGRGVRGRGLAIAAAAAAGSGGRLAAAPSAAGAVLVLELPVTASTARLAR